MKVAYIVSQFPKFSETFIQREIQELISYGYEVNVYSLLHVDNMNEEINIPNPNWINNITNPQLREILKNVVENSTDCLKQRHIYTQVINHLSGSPIEAIKYISLIPKISYIIRCLSETDVDHIHAHWATIPATVAYTIYLSTGIPYSFTGHAWDLHSSKSKHHFIGQKIENATHFITCTDYNQRVIKQRFPEHSDDIHLNYHGIDHEKYENSRAEREKTFLLAGGRLVPKKGIERLILVLIKYKLDNGVEIPAVIFGDGPEFERINRMKKKYGLKKLQLVGKIPHSQVMDLMAKSQFFVAPSVRANDGDIDGIPNVVLESFASSSPCVGSAISGIPEVVIDEKTGWLVSPTDGTELFNTVASAWRNPSICSKFGLEGRDLVQSKFDSRKNAYEFINLLEDNSPKSNKKSKETQG
ncbi:glycosyltransferase family 4 protein [Halomontanus rarus]|uniref:glycosyltransferase family 4 protein n=1 Tax=Halomontanus rarus TaxID=3034020 RepID=UPI0023E7BBC1|nr:glycosyltransferase family 4 protein [Halovivax sp. TS33]